MSYYAYDAEGFIGDVASIGGWGAFCTWGENKGPAIRGLIQDGHADPEELAKDLRDAVALDPGVKEICDNLLKMCDTAADVIIVGE